MGDKKTFKRDARLPFQEVQGQAIVVVPARRELHQFDEVGTFLWRALSRPRVVFLTSLLFWLVPPLFGLKRALFTPAASRFVETYAVWEREPDSDPFERTRLLGTLSFADLPLAERPGASHEEVWRRALQDPSERVRGIARLALDGKLHLCDPD